MTSPAVPHRGPDAGSTESWLVAAGRDRRPGSPLNVPLVPASNFVRGERRAHSRDDGTPTWEGLEEIVGGLEGGSAVAFASGGGGDDRRSPANVRRVPVLTALAVRSYYRYSELP